jgi:hypothetical protein
MRKLLKPFILLNLVILTFYVEFKDKIKDRQPHIELNQYSKNLHRIISNSLSFFIIQLRNIKGKARIIHPTQQNIKGMARIVSSKKLEK